jgi:hypothetical protein
LDSSLISLSQSTRIAANAAQNAARVATQTLVASQGAWIQIIKINVFMSLVFNEDGAMTAIGFEIANIGNAPALNMATYAWLVASHDDPAGDFGRELCDAIKNTKVLGGFTIFPGEKFPGKIGNTGWANGVFLSPDDIRKERNEDGSIALYVVGCVDYTFPTDASNHHQTRFILRMGLINPTASINPDDGIIPADSSPKCNKVA